MVLAPAALVVLGLLTHLPLELIILMQFAVWCEGHFLAPNSAAGVMMSHPQAAGAAAAVLGFVIWHRLKQYSLPPSTAA
ncbi:MAG: hypothetical protein VW057_04280 [Rhodospirillaceae bacterium]